MAPGQTDCIGQRFEGGDREDRVDYAFGAALQLHPGDPGDPGGPGDGPSRDVEQCRG